MLLRLGAVLLAAVFLPGCLTYEYEHEFWLRVDGAGTVYVTGRPALWAAFKQLGDPGRPDGAVTPEAVRALFEGAGLRVNRVTSTRRWGHDYVFVSASFSDVNKLAGTAAFPDLDLSLRSEANRLVLSGTWRGAPVPKAAPVPAADASGLMAVRFHLPSKIYSHKNAAEGVERGNILSWRQEVTQALAGERLELGAEMSRQSILFSTVLLFSVSIALAVALLGLGAWALVRRGRRDLAGSAPARPAHPDLLPRSVPPGPEV